MADQIDTRFGALDRRLAAALRHALDVAVTFPALALLNDVQLRLTSMVAFMTDTAGPGAGVLPEPSSHRWQEFMVDLFGPNEVGTRRSPVSLQAGKPNAVTLDHIKFSESYELSAREHQVAHALLAMAGAFIVEESIALRGILEQWNPSGKDDFVIEDLIQRLQHAGQVGVRLSEAAAAGTWAELLTGDASHVLPAVARPAVASRQESVAGHGRFSDDVDRIVLMVEPMDDDRRRALTARAIEAIRESMDRFGEAGSATQVVVVSARSGQHSEPMPLASGSSAEALDDGSSVAAFDSMLDQVARTVDTFGQADGQVATLEAPASGSGSDQAEPEWRGDFSIDASDEYLSLTHSTLRLHRPSLLILLVNSEGGGPPHGLLLPRSTPKHWQNHAPPVDANHMAHLWSPLSRASVVLISESPLETSLDSLVKGWSATGARDIQYHCLSSDGPSGIPRTGRHDRPSSLKLRVSASQVEMARTLAFLHHRRIHRRFLSMIILTAVLVAFQVIVATTVLSASWGAAIAAAISALWLSGFFIEDRLSGVGGPPPIARSFRRRLQGLPIRVAHRRKR